MFGAYRYILAMMVVVAHLGKLPGYNHSGSYAVFSFYILSGYLMTLVLNECYGFNLKGITRYLSNRALRLYPPYLAIMLFSIVIVLLIPDATRKINKFLVMPEAVIAWVSNIIIIGLYIDTTARLVPPAWSLFVEIAFYVLMALLLSRHRLIVFVWLALSVLYAAYLIYSSSSFLVRYSPLLAASLPFSVGAAIYHLKQWWVPGKRVLQAAVVLFVANLVLWYFFERGSVLNALMIGFYLNVLINAVIVLCICQLRDNKFDRFLGDLSYPLFLCHFQIGTIVVWLGGGMERGIWLLLLSLVPTHLGAYLVYLAVEKRLNKVRDRIRGVKADNSGAYQVRVKPEPSL